jgi:hypothetical protein
MRLITKWRNGCLCFLGSISKYIENRDRESSSFKTGLMRFSLPHIDAIQERRKQSNTKSTKLKWKKVYSLIVCNDSWTSAPVAQRVCSPHLYTVVILHNGRVRQVRQMRRLWLRSSTGANYFFIYRCSNYVRILLFRIKWWRALRGNTSLLSFYSKIIHHFRMGADNAIFADFCWCSS